MNGTRKLENATKGLDDLREDVNEVMGIFKV